MRAAAWSLQHHPGNTHKGFCGCDKRRLCGRQELLDLCYYEDSRATVDMNVVMTSTGQLIEVQATGEESPFDRKVLDSMLDLAQKGINELVSIQRQVLLSRG